MSTVPNKDYNLRQLFAKLGHSLEEIRVRSLQNILSKLEHSLLCDADLVQEKHLHIRLLEWFNFSSCPHQDLVLGLILRLSQHPSAAAIYLDVGAVEFLTQLQPNIVSSLHRTVDSILDNLFHLPSVDSVQQKRECVYQPVAVSDGNCATSHQLSSLSCSVEQPSLLHDALPYPHKSYPSPADQTRGYFVKTPTDGGEKLRSLRSEVVLRARCFKFSTFPWIALTPTDRHVLSSTDESVRSKDLSLVICACEFLSDVVFQDFPSEVFLQRPSIVKNVISLLTVDSLERSSIPLKALQTLHDLACGLLTRIYCCQDPALYTLKEEFLLTGTDVSLHSLTGHSANSSDSHYSFVGQGEARHRGDGQDVDNSSSSSTSSFQPPGNTCMDAMEQLAFEDVCYLQLAQWTIPQFCMAVLETVLPRLKSDNEMIIVRSLDLLHQVAALLRESVLPDELWTDESLPAREFVEKFHDALEIVAEVLHHHHHIQGIACELAAPSEIACHRVAFIGVAVRIMQFLELLVPLNRISIAIPSEFGSVLALIYQDKSLSYGYPELCEKALAFARAVDNVNPDLYESAQAICHSLSISCEFLLKFEEQNDDILLELVHLARESILSLSFHDNMQVVEACVKVICCVCKKTNPNPSAIHQSQYLLLRLLSYPLEEVRLSTYRAVFDIVKDALGIDHVVEPTSSATLAAMFIVDSKILYEICCFGMNDSKEMREISQKILLYLLQSQLLLTSTRWQQILNAIIPIMGVVECRCEPGSTLGNCIVGLMETDPRIETGTLPLLERLRGSLRLMFHKDERIRSEGVDRVVSLLSQEEGCLRKLPPFSDLDVQRLSSLFIVRSPRSLILGDKPSSVFQESDLKKVYDIFISDSVEIDIRKSAGEQMALIMQDSTLHKAFHQFAGISKLLEMLTLGLSLSEESKQWNMFAGMLPSIVRMLRCLVEADVVIRHQLAHEPKVYYAVLRSGIIHRKDELCQREVSELFGFLLFDELSSLQEWGPDTGALQQTSNFSLPPCVVERYVLPYKVAVHHQLSPWKVVIPPDSHPLRQGLLLEMMKVTWTVAWHGDDIEAAIKSALKFQEKKDSESGRLAMTCVEGVILSTSFLPSALCQCLFDVENATSHAAVSQAILRISSYLVMAEMSNANKLLHSLSWRDAISKFLLVTPCSTLDELLLFDIVDLLQLIIRHQSNIPTEAVNWLAEMLLNPKAAFQTLLARNDSPLEADLTESAAVARRQLNRSLLKFVAEFVGRYPYNLSSKSAISRCVNGDMAKFILARINRADTVQSYNLSSLKLTLSCLMQITARPRWSLGCSTSDCLSLNLKMLQSLLEVVSAFHVGRGGMSMSYMGRGITRCTALCLRHLAHEMATQLQSQDWPRNWLFTRHAMVDSVGESGLHWLFPLWSYRDTEVRAAGVGIAMALASTESGRITMTTQCHSIPGGIWAVAFSVLLDAKECSLVRQQAALLLVNLTSQSMPSGTVLQSTPDTVWQGPVVMNEDTQASLVGLSALLVLLHHTDFYNKVCVLLNKLYTNPMIHASVNATDISGSAQVTTLDSQLTLTTSGSATPVASNGLLVDLGSFSQPGPSLLANTTHDSEKNFIPVNERQHRVTGEGIRTGNNPSAGVDSVSNLSSDTELIESQSVVTPSLASSVCLLLSNLVILSPEDAIKCISKQGIFKSLLRILNAELLRAYQSGLSETKRHHKGHWMSAFQQLLNLQCDVMRLVKICINQEAELCQQFLEDGAMLRQLVMMLGIAYPADPDTSSCCLSVWETVLNLLSSGLLTSGQEAFLAMCPVIVKHWKIIAGRVVSILQDKQLQDSELWQGSLNFLALLLTEEAKLKARLQGQRPENIYFITDRLDNPENKDGDDDIFSCSTGTAILCQMLVKAFDVGVLKPPELFASKAAAVNALKSLLAVSSAAKVAALEAGLLETLLEHINRLQLKISAEMLDVIKASKKKTNPMFLEMIMVLELLRNFLFNSEDVKLCACKSGLSSLIHSIWTWCQLELSLMSCVLALLCSYTAHCPQASSSLAFTSASAYASQPKLQVKALHSSNSLVHCLIKLLQKESNTGNQTILKQGFALAAILTQSLECRGILWKSNFLQEFSSFSLQKSKKTKTNVLLETLWLNLLLNLSFTTDGQNMIYKITDGIPILLEFAFSGQEIQQKSALLLIRNLCFNSANKLKLLTNERLIPLLLRDLDMGSSYLKSISCSAVFALLYNNQKAKGILKNTHVMRKLQDASNLFASISSEQAWADSCAQTLKDIFILLKI